MDITWRNTTVKDRPISIVVFYLSVLSVAMSAGGVLCQSPAGTSSTMGSGSAGVSSGSGASAASRLATGGGLPGVLPRDFAQLRIEAGDLLSVSVYDTPELTDAYRVDPRGNVTLPLCGKVKVEGLTADEAGRLLETTLKDNQVLNHPQVNVDVQQYAGEYVTVLGEVASPGRVTVLVPTKLSDILAQSGGLTSLAGTRIKIRRGDDNAAPEVDAPYSRSESNQETGTILVRPGDTVIVPRAGIVYVLGAVFKPGGYLMQEDGKLNVAEALAMSGGTILQARTNGLRVIRRNPDGSVLNFALSYDGIARGSQNPLQLEAQDIVYVPVSKLKATLTDATGIISTAVSATIYTAR
jgi:polysaccharide export outer membrane protein